MSDLILKKTSTIDLGVKYASLVNKSMVDTIADSNNIEVINAIVEHLVTHSNATLYFMGVGKNSYLSHKLAATCQSLNIKASYLDAVHFMHGDAGTIRPGDLIIAFSKSGKTAELLHTLKYIRNNNTHFKTKIVSVFAGDSVTAYASPIAELSNHAILLKNLSEVDDFGTVPTVSALVMQFIGDIIALQLASTHGLTKPQFGLTHPGGLIGSSINK